MSLPQQEAALAELMLRAIGVLDGAYRVLGFTLWGVWVSRHTYRLLVRLAEGQDLRLDPADDLIVAGVRVLPHPTLPPGGFAAVQFIVGPPGFLDARN